MLKLAVVAIIKSDRQKNSKISILWNSTVEIFYPRQKVEHYRSYWRSCFFEVDWRLLLMSKKLYQQPFWWPPLQVREFEPSNRMVKSVKGNISHKQLFSTWKIEKQCRFSSKTFLCFLENIVCIIQNLWRNCIRTFHFTFAFCMHALIGILCIHEMKIGLEGGWINMLCRFQKNFFQCYLKSWQCHGLNGWKKLCPKSISWKRKILLLDSLDYQLVIT